MVTVRIKLCRLLQTDSNSLLCKFKHFTNTMAHVSKLAVLVVINLFKMNESPLIQDLATEVLQ